jgi:hypothetical protein
VAEHGFGTRAAGPGLGEANTPRSIRFTSDIVVRPKAPAAAWDPGTHWYGRRRLMVGVRTADCVPILLADTRRRAAPRPRGLARNARRIAARAVGAMGREFGTRPLDLVAAIGTAIGPCC